MNRRALGDLEEKAGQAKGTRHHRIVRGRKLSVAPSRLRESTLYRDARGLTSWFGTEDERSRNLLDPGGTEVQRLLPGFERVRCETRSEPGNVGRIANLPLLKAGFVDW